MPMRITGDRLISTRSSGESKAAMTRLTLHEIAALALEAGRLRAEQYRGLHLK